MQAELLYPGKRVSNEVIAILWDGSQNEAGNILEFLEDYSDRVRCEYKETNETVHKKHPEIRLMTDHGKYAVYPGEWIVIRKNDITKFSQEDFDNTYHQ